MKCVATILMACAVLTMPAWSRVAAGQPAATPAEEFEAKLGYQTGVNKLSVAELALSYMIVGLRWITPLSLAMRQGEKPRTRVGRNLSGRKVGLHGCGHIGKEVVRLLKPFDCEIFVHDKRGYPDFYRTNGITPVSFDTAAICRRTELSAQTVSQSVKLKSLRSTVGGRPA